jgi:hypothetical protein
MALTELTTGLYDRLAPHFGWPKVATPQEATDRVLDHFGVKRPSTTVERMTEATASGVAGAAGPARAAGEIATTAAGPVVKRIAEKMAENPIAQTVSGGTSAAAAQGTAEAGGGPLAQFAASVLGSLTPSVAGKAARMTLPGEPREAAVDARKAGYVLPPAAISEKPGVVSSTLAAPAGKIKTQQASSSRNQEVTNGLAAKALGLPPDTPLNKSVFEDVRDRAGQAYKAVGQAVPVIWADGTYRQEISHIANTVVQNAKQSFPNLLATPQIDRLVNELRQPGANVFSPEAGLALVKRLRFDANAHFQARDNPETLALAVAERQAATAIDDLMDRQITGWGKPDVIAQYRAARQQIAKSYDVEAATNPSTGDVNAQRIAALTRLNRAGVARSQLTGELETIANAANAFPKAMQPPSGFGHDEGWSALDFFAAVGSAAAGHPGAAAAVVARPVIRTGVLTGPYQDWMTRWGPAASTWMPPTSVAPLPLLTQPGLTAVVPPSGDLAAHIDPAYGIIATTPPQQ